MSKLDPIYEQDIEELVRSVGFGIEMKRLLRNLESTQRAYPEPKYGHYCDEPLAPYGVTCPACITESRAEFDEAEQRRAAKASAA